MYFIFILRIRIKKTQTCIYCSFCIKFFNVNTYLIKGFELSLQRFSLILGKHEHISKKVKSKIFLEVSKNVPQLDQYVECSLVQIQPPPL